MRDPTLFLRRRGGEDGREGPAKGRDWEDSRGLQSGCKMNK